MNYPLDSTILERPLTKVQQEAHLIATEAKLGVDLGEVGLHQLLHRFSLHDHAVVHNQIHPVGSFDQQALPIDIHVDLS